MLVLLFGGGEKQMEMEFSLLSYYKVCEAVCVCVLTLSVGTGGSGETPARKCFCGSRLVPQGSRSNAKVWCL